MVTYLIVTLLLIVVELVYFRIADKYNIIDKPNERSSHSTIVLRGGGIIFAISMLVWYLWFMVNDAGCMVEYLPFLGGLLMVAGVSFVDDIHSLPDSLRMVVQIVSILLMFWSIGLFDAFGSWIWNVGVILVALFFCVGATNIINFMDGVNGITAAYALAMLVPIAIVNNQSRIGELENGAFIEPSYLVVAIIGITAALALPNLSQGIDEDKYVMMAKATYSELDSGFSRMLANKSLDEIYTDANATTDDQRCKAIVDELSKYVKMGKNCGNSLTQCYNSSKSYKEADGSVIDDTWPSGKSSNSAAFTLLSGAVVIVYGNDEYIKVDFDVDGEKLV